MANLMPPNSGTFGGVKPPLSTGGGHHLGLQGAPVNGPAGAGAKLTGSARPADFDALEAESRKLTAHIPSGEAAPPLWKDLHELGQAYKVLGGTADMDMTGSMTEGLGMSTGNEQRALRLLAQKNFDAGEAVRQVAAMEMQPAYEPLEPLGPVDIEGYLAHHHDMIVLTAIEETRTESESRVKRAHRRRLASKWEEDKKRLLQNLGAKTGQWAQPSMLSKPQTEYLQQRKFQRFGTPHTTHFGAFAGSGPAPMDPHAPGGTGGLEDRSLSEMTLSMRQHAAVVQRLNQPFLRTVGISSMNNQTPAGGFSTLSTAVSVGKPSKPVAEFAKLASGMDVGHQGSLHHHVFSGYQDCWRLLGSILRETKGGQVNPSTRLTGTSEYLEELFLEHLRRKVERADAQGQLKMSARKNLDPGIRADVADFVQVQRSQGHLPRASEVNVAMVYNQPLWPQVYYNLRCGSPADAAEAVDESIKSGYSGVDRAVADALRSLARGEMDLGAEDKVRELYEYMISRTVPNEVDPFYAVCLSLISNHEPQVKPAYRDAIEVTIEDFVWIGLWFSQKKDFQLTRLQAKVLKWGHRHFDKEGRTPFSYARILFLVQLFERGVNYLVQAGLLLEGTHLALALNSYKVLDTSEQSHDSVNFAQLLLDYTYSFQRSDPEVALEYILQLKHNDDEALLNKNLLHLLISTPQLNKLVGELQPDGRRAATGFLDRYLEPQSVRQVLYLAGSSAEEKGLFVEAVGLLALAGAYKDMLAVFINRLGSVLVPPNAQRIFWADQATAFYAQHLAEGQHTSVRDDLESTSEGTASLETFVKLMNLMVFFDRCKDKQYSEAMDILDRLYLLPSSSADVQQRLSSAMQLDLALQNNYPEILLKGMECVFNLYTNLKQRASSVSSLQVAQFGEHGDAAMQKLAQYKEKANILVTFCGLMGTKFKNDTAARLARMEVMMI